MTPNVQTYIQQARAFLLEGDAVRAIDLLKRAKACCGEESHVKALILKDLMAACRLAGRPEEAGRHYLELTAMTPVGVAENVSFRSNGNVKEWWGDWRKMKGAGGLRVRLLAILLAAILLFASSWVLWPRNTKTSKRHGAMAATVSKLGLASHPPSAASDSTVKADWDRVTATDDTDTEARATALQQLIVDSERMTNPEERKINLASAHAVRSSILFGTDNQAAMADADAAISEDPELPMCAIAYVIQGFCLMGTDKQYAGFLRYTPTATTARIIADFTKATQMRPSEDFVASCAYLGLYIEDLYAGRDAAASEHIRQAVALNPKSDVAQAYLRAELTMRYWRDAWRAVAFCTINLSDQATSQQRIGVLRSAIDRINGLSAVSVDADAVQCVLAYKNWLSDLTDFAEYNANGQTLVLAFLRGANGDPFGEAADVQNASNDLREKQKVLARMLDDTTAILSSRYGVEF